LLDHRQALLSKGTYDWLVKRANAIRIKFKGEVKLKQFKYIGRSSATYASGQSAISKNVFLLNSLGAYGGKGGKVILRDVMRFSTAGGDTADSIAYIENYDSVKIKRDCTLSYTREDYARIAFGSFKTNYTYTFDPKKITYNGNTSPGISWRQMGFKKKWEVGDMGIQRAQSMLKIIDAGRIPIFYWYLAGRPKTMKTIEAVQKVVERKPMGRAIWVCDFEESLLCKPILDELEHKLLNGNPFITRVMVGVNKYAQGDVLKKWADQYPMVGSLDYSKFDVRMPPTVIRMAFDVLKFVLGDDPMTNKVLNTIEYNFINSRVVLPNGEIYQNDYGIPSGSGMTSIIGSLCNLIMLTDILKPLENDPRSAPVNFIVYGDDSLIGFTQEESFQVKAVNLNQGDGTFRNGSTP